MTKMSLYKVRTDEKASKKGTWELCGYWDGISPIHKFFYENVIKGGDPRAFYIVDEEILDRLQLLCYIVLMNKGSDVKIDVANALLPLDELCSGKIDDDYFAILEETHKMLRDVFEEGVLFIYRETL